MQRYFVCRAYIKWKGKLYYKGDLLPETFTHHDKARHVHNSRIGVCEVTDLLPPPVVPTPITSPLSGGEVVVEVLPAELPEQLDELPEVSENGTPEAAFNLLKNF